MKRIGLLDQFLDNFHANFLPRWIEACGRNNDYTITHAFALENSPRGMDNASWCAQRGVQLCPSAQEVVEHCDVIAVLAPSHPQSHELLAKEALCSGKPVFIDKTMAVSAAQARGFFATSAAHKTPLFSSSALRFAGELAKAREFLNGEPPAHMMLMCPGNIAEYSVHLCEMAVVLGVGDQGRVLAHGPANNGTVLFEFRDGRTCVLRIQLGCSYGLWVSDTNGKGLEIVPISHEFFINFTRALLEFFDGKSSPAPPSETIKIHMMIDAILDALRKPGAWQNFEFENES